MRNAFIDHITIEVGDFEASRRFYEAALAPFGLNVKDWRNPDNGKPEAEFGPPGSEDFAITPGVPGTPLHIAFAATDRETVNSFHAAALGAGGRDNGPPGPRPKYSARYYAAFVFDPDGNNVEAVFHEPE